MADEDGCLRPGDARLHRIRHEEFCTFSSCQFYEGCFWAPFSHSVPRNLTHCRKLLVVTERDHNLQRVPPIVFSSAFFVRLICTAADGPFSDLLLGPD